MLRIRLQRTGRKNKPFYRIVVAEHSSPVKAKYVERLGQYNPLASPKLFEIDEKKLAEWIKKGAQPSSTIARILKGRGMKDMEKYIETMPDRKKNKQTEEPVAAPVAAAPAPVAEEAPKEESEEKKD